MDEHPGIVFRSGPAGRRAGLVSGPDVWEVVAVHRSFDESQRTADWLDQQATAIETALRYYEAHQHEIDEWIRRNEEAAEAAERVARASAGRFLKLLLDKMHPSLIANELRARGTRRPVGSRVTRVGTADAQVLDHARSEGSSRHREHPRLSSAG